MKQKIIVSAPGKIILLGEHTVVYNKPALFAAIDKRCFITISPRKDNKINIVSKNLKAKITTDFEKINAKFAKAQKDWIEFNKTNNIQLLKSTTREPLDYAQIIIGQFLNFSKTNKTSFLRKQESSISKNFSRGFDLLIDSQIPVGSGCGSSAALAVSIIGAIITLSDKNLDKKTINDIALLAERKKHGNPSGGDNTASTFGGLIWFKKDEEIKPLNIKISPEITKNFYIINTGTPDESTGEMVGLVRDLYQNNPKATEIIFNEQGTLTGKFLDALKKADEKEIIKCIKKAEKNLEKLGIVSPSTISLIKKIEITGGTAKISGAGGKKNNSGIILIYHKNLQALSNLLKSYNLFHEPLKINAEGVRIDL